MNPGEIQDLVELLIEIGGSLAQAGFEVALKQVTFQGYINLFWAVLAFIATVSCVLLLRKAIKEEKAGNRDWEEMGFIFFLVGALMFAAFIATFQYAVSRIAVPEWYAIESLLGLLP